MTEERWVSVEEIAQHLCVSKDSVYSWINSRGMPAHRIGKKWRFKRSEVDAWVVSGKAADSMDEGTSEGEK